MVRNIKVGDRLRLIHSAGSLQLLDFSGKILADWPARVRLCTVTAIDRHLIFVQPDPPGFGVFSGWRADFVRPGKEKQDGKTH